jgi:hypothetical protein
VAIYHDKASGAPPLVPTQTEERSMYPIVDSEAWGIAGRPGTPGYSAALLELARRRDELPGLVCLEVPKKPAAEWEEITVATEAICRCGRLRVIIPTQSRSWRDLMPGSSMTRGVGQPIEIAPWGGIREATCLRMTVTDDAMIAYTEWPYMPPDIARWLTPPRSIPEPTIRLDFVQGSTGRDNSLPITCELGEGLWPLGSEVAADAMAKSLTIQLDRTAVVVDEKSPRHDCT